jgi:predicted dehydrogenase
VAAVATSRPETAAEAVDAVEALCGQRPAPRHDLDDLLAEPGLDALAILSPAASHEGALRAALSAGLHVLCEKPLVWPGPDFAERTRLLVDGFAERGLLLEENCQWPWTLPAFRELHPDLGRDTPQRFEMWLSPTLGGIELVGDSMSHPLSLLQSLAPGPGSSIRDIRLTPQSDPVQDLDLAFHYEAPGARISCRVALRHGTGPPRRAGFAVDGRGAERVITDPGYRMAMACGDRNVALPDPLDARVADFVAALQRVRRGEAPRRAHAIAERADMLAALADAFRTQIGAPSVDGQGPDAFT